MPYPSTAELSKRGMEVDARMGRCTKRPQASPSATFWLPRIGTVSRMINSNASQHVSAAASGNRCDCFIMSSFLIVQADADYTTVLASQFLRINGRESCDCPREIRRQASFPHPCSKRKSQYRAKIAVSYSVGTRPLGTVSAYVEASVPLESDCQ